MVADAYPPMRTSCAVQMYDLGQAFIEDGHQVTMIVPVSAQAEKVRIQTQDGVQLVQVRTLQTKDVNYAQRTIAEWANPFVIWRHLKKHPHFISAQYNGVIWYSPTIFWGPLIKRLKQYFQIPSYLILRDIFPDWAIDLGILKKGPAYLFLKSVEHYQYRQANTIGVQSPNNLIYFKEKHPQLMDKTQVLWNWGGKSDSMEPCSINLDNSSLAGRAICIYAGNMGVAQGIETLFHLAASLKDQSNLGFVFVGRGSEVEGLRKRINNENLSNILLFDEIDHYEIPSLYAQCSIGLLSLDLRHRTHNIPGKFITYLYAGLPVFGLVNSGNDLLDIVNQAQIGSVATIPDLALLKERLIELVGELGQDSQIAERCNTQAQKLFSTQVAQNQILGSLLSIY